MIALSTLALPLRAAEPPREVDFRPAQSSFSIVGIKVVNLQGDTLGNVKDLALDLENGRIVEVIVASPRGFLGLDERTVAVPPGALTYDLVGKTLRLNMDKEQFKAAPDFDVSNWEQHWQSGQVAASYVYFGQQPYFAADGQGSTSGNTAVEPLGYIQRSSKLLRLPVKNLQSERLGSVDSFQYDLAKGKVSHVILLSPGFAQSRSVIPARALRFNAMHDGLQLDVTKQAFMNEPRFKWTFGKKGEFQQETYANTEVATNDGVNTRQNVQAGIVDTYTPLAQGSSFADVDLTYRIYTAMRADTSLSENSKNVEVGTLNSRITLRGHVYSEAGKRSIGAIAAIVGRPENVSNLLEVRPLPVSIRLAN